LVFATSASTNLNFSFNATDQASAPGEGVLVELILVNDGPTQENNDSVEVPFPSSMSSIFETELDGGDCPSNTCGTGETIVWALKRSSQLS